MKTKLLSLLLLIIGGLSVNAQEKCGTIKILNEKIAKDPSVHHRMEQIEQFTQQYISNRKLENIQSAIITIPVVVHVIHNGEAVGTGANISDLQILSQIEALNEDFRLQNFDSLQPSHPFWAYTADTEIEFCFAEQDEFGNPTTGIERIDGGQADWDPTDIDDILKPATIWDRDLYLNIWTVKYDAANSTLLGYAQFPGGADSTDGVVCRYDAFGYTGNVTPPNDLGRTMTHEVGHWINLRHIWGDDSPQALQNGTCDAGECSGDDFVGDTPDACEPNYGCKTFPWNAFNLCGTDADGEMYMNYMDYGDDACLVMFTYDQGLRMQAALNGPRSTLLTSNGCTPSTNGMNESDFSNSVKIFPNPSNGIFTITFSSQEKYKIIITNTLGESVLETKTLSAAIRIDLTNQSNGIYFLQISSNDKSITKKVIVSK